MAVTTKKGKWHLISRGPSIPIVDLETKTVGPPLILAIEGEVAAPLEIAPTMEVVPSSTMVTTFSTSRVASTSNAAAAWPLSSSALKGSSSSGPSSWQSKLSPRSDYLLGGVPPEDLESLRKSLGPSALH